jgi:hypothetical protein
VLAWLCSCAACCRGWPALRSSPGAVGLFSVGDGNDRFCKAGLAAPPGPASPGCPGRPELSEPWTLQSCASGADPPCPRNCAHRARSLSWRRAKTRPPARRSCCFLLLSSVQGLPWDCLCLESNLCGRFVPLFRFFLLFFSLPFYGLSLWCQSGCGCGPLSSSPLRSEACNPSGKSVFLRGPAPLPLCAAACRLACCCFVAFCAAGVSNGAATGRAAGQAPSVPVVPAMLGVEIGRELTLSHCPFPCSTVVLRECVHGRHHSALAALSVT